uniref:Uncharacterized protein n=1 Tax=Fibrocapsa japonica TaxID=94617 RepID=A0A7S2UVR2_9STRA|mmetsp:Transcript_15800/g.23228  ORF Transcript_15800/g.23228 Transcript_15800/m.23228 type:complete len:403 (+) Transcript_15800:99-1307(+)
MGVFGRLALTLGILVAISCLCRAEPNYKCCGQKDRIGHVVWGDRVWNLIKAKQPVYKPPPKPAPIVPKPVSKYDPDAQRKAILALLATGGVVAFLAFMDPITTALMSAIDWLPILPYQLFAILAFLGSAFCGTIPGRLDQMRHEIGWRPKKIELFTPAPWALTIWAPILIGEAIFAVYQALPLDIVQSSVFIPLLTVPFVGAMLCQMIWCLVNRPFIKKSSFGWLSPVLITLGAYCLNLCSLINYRALHSDEMNIIEYVLISIPLTLHFAWMTIKSLVAWNGWLAIFDREFPKTKVAFAGLSALAAIVLGAYFAIERTEPFVALVVSWALAGIADRRGWYMMEGLLKYETLQKLSTMARVGSIVCLGSAVQPVLQLFASIAEAASETGLNFGSREFVAGQAV